jgi:hypothetical protein
MIKRLLLFFAFLAGQANAQCDSVAVNNDLVVSSDALMAGIYVVNGTFTVQAGVTIYVTPFSSNSCGALKIYADNIEILGNINGDYAGYPGGNGGNAGSIVSSLTGHVTALDACTGTGNTGNVSVEGGKAGMPGYGPGAGGSGSDGSTGSGSKQYCGNFGDEAGVVGGSGGAGGGAGGSYGGQGSNGSAGGSGSTSAVTNGLTVEASYPIVGGSGGLGGSVASVYGSASGFDIDLGSGGAGSGGGGRSTNAGTSGSRGGNGGGIIFLKAENSLIVSGFITAKGENGLNGGNGGNGDASPGCCSDGCDGCDEKTYSTGAGAGAGSGGGSGGGIYLETLGTASITGSLNAIGGNGGNNGNKGTGVTCTYENLVCSDNSITTGDGTNGGKGGAGGGGRIKIFVPECADATVEPATFVEGGTGNTIASSGTYEFVCGYAGLQEELFADVVIYPNPAQNFIKIKLNEQLMFLGNPINMVITDMGGREVLVKNLELQFEQIIVLSDLTKGYYFVRLESNNSIFNTKLIVQ